MYITSTGGIKTAETVKKKQQKNNKDGFSQQFSEVSEAESQPPKTASTPINAVNHLLTLQEVDEQPSAMQEIVYHANGVLDVLDDIRLALLSGRLSQQHLLNIQDKLELLKQKHQADDTLVRIINDIETRAAVELAKYSVS